MSFDIKSVKFGSDDAIQTGTIEEKRGKVIKNIEAWIEFMQKGKPDNPEKKVVAPVWLSRTEGGQRHFRLKFAQRNLQIGPKGEERMTTDLSVDPFEVFDYLKERVISGAYDKSIQKISGEIRTAYQGKKGK